MAEDRILLIMPEFTFGGAEVQLRYIIDGLEKEKRPADVIVLHQLVKKNVNAPGQDFPGYRHIRFFEVDLFGTVEEEMKWRINLFLKERYADGDRYYAALIFHDWITVIIPLLKRHGITVIYSERVSGNHIIKNQKFHDCILKCDLLTCNSVAAKQRIEAEFKKPVRVILNGKPDVKRLDYGKRERIRKLLVPANIDPRKNQEILIDLLDKFRNEEYRVRFIGKVSSQDYLNCLRSAVREKGLSESVDFAVLSSNMEEEYQNTDIVILPSFSEGTPNVVLEAFAYGIPVVVSDIEAEQALVKDPRYRFDPRNADDLYRTIKSVENMDETELEDMLRENSQFVKESFGLKRMTDEYLEVFNEAKKIHTTDNEYDLEKDVYNDVAFLGNELRKSREFYHILCDLTHILQSGSGLKSYFEHHGYKRVSIYGIKELGRIIKKELERNGIGISDIIDKDPEAGFPDIQVVSPDEMGKADVIVVTATFYYREIEHELKMKTEADIVSLKDVVSEVKGFTATGGEEID